MDSVKKFYDDLADDYHLIFEDWDASMRHQSNILDEIVKNYFDQSRQNIKIFDCSCGIGTQAIGLALLGYIVHATDLSPSAVIRAEQEAKRLNANLSFGVADFRSLNQVEGKYNIVISCDNSLPHLLDEAGLHKTLRNIWEKLNDGGLFLASIRDYDQLLQEKPQSTFPTVYDDDKGKRIVFQIWNWEENNIYTLEHFIIKKYGDELTASSRSTKYRAMMRSEISNLLSKIGFTDIIWHLPEETGYYQPIVTARKN